MIGSHGSIKVDFLVAAHCLQHICWPVIVERFYKTFRCPPNITKMHEMNLLLPSKEANGLGDIRPHSGDGSLAEGNAIPFTRQQFKPTLEGINRGKESGDAANGRDGWIIWVECQLDSCLLSNRDNTFEEVRKIIPE